VYLIYIEETGELQVMLSDTDIGTVQNRKRPELIYDTQIPPPVTG
jgi:hypothetical protein